MDSSKYIINGYSLANIRNRHEVRVIDILRRLMPQHKTFCGCRLCVEDVYALALNAFPPHYVQRGAIVLRQQPPSEEDLERAVREAMDQVAERPNHPADERAGG